MNESQVQERIRDLWKQIKRFKYTAVFFLIGVVLLLVLKKEAPAVKENDEDWMMYYEELEDQLEMVLSQVEGAGKVEVLLAYEDGEVHSYQEDRIERIDESGREIHTETVFHDTDSGDSPVCVKVSYPTYRGAVVVCQGADKASVRLNLLKAVSSLTGLSSDHITVIKMKGK